MSYGPRNTVCRTEYWISIIAVIRNQDHVCGTALTQQWHGTALGVVLIMRYTPCSKKHVRPPQLTQMVLLYPDWCNSVKLKFSQTIYVILFNIILPSVTGYTFTYICEPIHMFG